MNRSFASSQKSNPTFTDMLDALGKQMADVMEHSDCPDYVGEALASAVESITQKSELNTAMFARYLLVPSVMGDETSASKLIH